MRVQLPNVGPILAILEHHADIYLITRTKVWGMSLECWRLRSDRFPGDWDGREVGATFYRADPKHLRFSLNGRAVCKPKINP